MIELVQYSSAEEVKWNAFIACSRNAVFFHHRNFLSYHADRFNECSLIFKKKGNICAVFPATAHDDMVISHGGITFAGLLMNYDLKQVEVLTIFDLLKMHYQQKGFRNILYKAVPTIFSKYPAQEDLYALFRSNATLCKRDISSCINIQEPIKFSETKRQLVRKCESNGVIVAEQKDFTGFWRLLSAVLKNHHQAMPTHSVSEISLLASRFPENIMLYEACLNGELLAGVVLFRLGDVIHTQYMANSEAGRKLGVLDYIIHILLTKEFKDAHWLNFGISTEKSGSILNEGLIQQKELLGGRGIVYDSYQIAIT